jgi:hypothetical protein
MAGLRLASAIRLHYAGAYAQFIAISRRDYHTRKRPFPGWGAGRYPGSCCTVWS